MTLKKVVMTDPKQEDYHYEEAIKILRTNIQFTGMETKTITVTSCYPNEGKSDVSLQLAREMGKMEKKVLLIDADIRKSNFVSRYLIAEKIAGLSEYLSGQKSLHDILYTTNFPGVDIIFSGPVAPNPSELLSQSIFSEMVRSMREKYDYVLIDTPPLSSMIDGAVVAKNCDGAVMVIESGVVSRRQAAKVKEQIEMSGCRLLGAVLNKVDAKDGRYYKKYSSYYYKSNKT